MDRPLNEHLFFSTDPSSKMNRLLMDKTQTQAERNRLESEIRAAELALTYYRKVSTWKIAPAAWNLPN
jgi:hypothetical protein